MAFPSKDRKDADEHFLAPYKPENFDQVNVKRNRNSGFLFRIDPHPGGNVSILVLSAKEPDWDYAFHNAGYLLVGPPDTPRTLNLHIEPGTKFRFKLKTNPTRKVKTLSKEERKNKVPKRHGTRFPVRFEELDNWLARKGEQCGFKLLGETAKTTGYSYFDKLDEKQKSRLLSVMFEGKLEVTDECMFRHALITGIGPAKAFGFGLLTIAPI